MNAVIARSVPRSVRLLAISASVAVAVVAIAAFVQYFARSPQLLVTQGPLSFRPEVAETLGLFFNANLLRNGQMVVHLIGLATFWTIGGIILTRGGDAPMRLFTAVMLITVGAALFSPLSVLDGGWWWAADLVGTLRPRPEVWRSAAGLTVLLFSILFPTGRPLARQWTAGFVAIALHALAWAAFQNTAIDPRTWTGWATATWTALPAVFAVAALTARFARSDDATRHQTRLVVVAFGATIGTIIAFWALDPRLEQGLFDLVLATRRLEALHDLNLLLLLSVTLLLLPIAVGISVVRYGLWDIDLLVNRALVYGSLTASVAAAFVAGLIGIGSLLAGSLGQGRVVAGVVTGVLLVLVFQPLRRRIQNGVDRRFYREKYDAERVLDDFARSIVDLVDAESVTQSVTDVLLRTVHPTFSMIVVDGDSVVPNRSGVIERESADSALADAFPPGAELLLPLVAHGTSLGGIYLGPRLSGQQYTAIDRHLMERIASAAAPAVRVSQLVDEQERHAADRMRLESEMAVARTIQRDLLPKDLPVADGWRFGAAYESAMEVGGDYYDVMVRPDGQVAVLVADVSGKGVPAAMLMATCRAIVRSVATEGGAAEVLTAVNARLFGDIHPGMFITCFFGILDPATGTLSFANAGHTLPMIRRLDGATTELRATGMPFGWLPDASYEETVVAVEPGSLVVIPSDGVIEARDMDGTFFGVEGFRNMVAGATSPEVVDDILDALRAHCAPSLDLGDDVTMLAFARSK